jgi:ATP phosphoribosyltransferase regulatory subunit
VTAHIHWLLPEGIEELLPPDTWRLEALRRRLLDLYRSWGYELAIPPLVEFLDALLTGAGRDLDLQTIKFVDQLSGRLMGVRADMTPQAARIDAHQLKRDHPVRLCYLGPVLRALPDRLGGIRNPLQVGAELFGHSGVESDVEILGLMLETLRVAGIDEVFVDLGHVGIFRGLAEQGGLDPEDEARLFDLLQRKDRPDIETFLQARRIGAPIADMLRALPDLNGDADVVTRARQTLAAGAQPVAEALDTLDALARVLAGTLPHVALHFDLAELRGYQYQTGVVFAAYVPGYGQEVARGGRYDRIGEIFGRARSATGFSADMKTLVALGQPPDSPVAAAILAPWGDDPMLHARIRELRAEGEVVIMALPGQPQITVQPHYDRSLVLRHGQWVVEPR